jgi:hypothetical protein
MAAHDDQVAANGERPLIGRMPRQRSTWKAIGNAHQDATNRSLATYIDPVSGYDCFTATALVARGRCCHCNCRHCPYADGERIDDYGSDPTGEGLTPTEAGEATMRCSDAEG